MHKRIFIGLGGNKGSGKSHVAKQIGTLAAGEKMTCEVFSFATPLKSMLEALMLNQGFSVSARRAYMTTDKEQPIKTFGGLTMRHMMQTLGTEWARNHLHPDFWVMLARNSVEQTATEVVIFDDVRFPNEAELIYEMGGGVFRLDTPHDIFGSDSHVSETSQYRHEPVWNDRQSDEAAMEIWKHVNVTK